METRVACLNWIAKWISFSNTCFTIMALEMENLNPSSQVQEQYYLDDEIKSAHRFPHTHHSQMYAKFLILKAEPSAFTSIRPRPEQQVAVFGVQNCLGF
jgi:hypothetical protein